MLRPNCTFFSKTNSCKHGPECIKTHKTQPNNQCIVLKNLYLYPKIDSKSQLNDFEIDLHSEIFIIDVFQRLSQDYGEIKNILVAINSCRHIAGNVYVQFVNEEAAESALVHLKDRTYYYTKIKVERGAMFDIKECVCEDYVKGKCQKNGDCSYVHPLSMSKDFLDRLYKLQYMFYNEKRQRLSNS